MPLQLHTTASSPEDPLVLTVLRGVAPILRIAEGYVKTVRHVDVLVPCGGTGVVLRSLGEDNPGDFMAGQDADAALDVAEVWPPTCPEQGPMCQAQASSFTLFRLDVDTATQVTQAPNHPASPRCPMCSRERRRAADHRAVVRGGSGWTASRFLDVMFWTTNGRREDAGPAAELCARCGERAAAGFVLPVAAPRRDGWRVDRGEGLVRECWYKLHIFLSVDTSEGCFT